jgi:hypothetical protein
METRRRIPCKFLNSCFSLAIYQILTRRLIKQWLAADPSLISVLETPLKYLPNTEHFPLPPRAAPNDPFNSLPVEVVLEIFSYLSSSDVFSLKSASPRAMVVVLPESYYRRFLRREFRYLPKLTAEITKEERAMKTGCQSRVDWRGSFERLRRLVRTPRLAGHPEDEDYGKEWAELDIGLKNRSRIWRIVQPIAEALVETSPGCIRALHGAHRALAERTSVVRGYVGRHSTNEGVHQTVYVGSRCDSEDDAEDEIPVTITKIRFWHDGPSGVFRGLEFHVDGRFRHDTRSFGRQGSEHTDVVLVGETVAGFAFCFADGIVCGVQAFFLPNHVRDGQTTHSKRIGKWDGYVRRISVPHSWRKFVGLTGFVNSKGYIEMIGILEEAHHVGAAEDEFGPLNPPPRTVPLSHDQASLWRGRLPPATVVMHEREGPDVPDWRISGSEWEIWQHGHCEAGSECYQSTSYRRLEKIIGYYDERFLRGLEFVYAETNRRRSNVLMGVREGTKQGTMELPHGQSIIASVISFGDEGIHGILVRFPPTPTWDVSYNPIVRHKWRPGQRGIWAAISWNT